MAYPRPLRATELDILETVLPADRPVYRALLERLQGMMVLGEGRRGDGDIVLGAPGDAPDIQSPLPPVIAFGMVETGAGSYSVTVREEAGGQVNVEIVSGSGAGIPDHFEEKRRWTYSRWLPGEVSPATGTRVREVTIEPGVTLALAPAEKRIWVHELPGGSVRLIPVTNLYNELMIVRGERNPRIALAPSLLWENLASFPDRDLRGAFAASDRLRRRESPEAGAGPARRPGISRILSHLFTGRR